MKCIFCEIVKKKIPSKIIEETKDILVIEDIKPKAPIHLLIIPKKHIKSVIDLKEKDSKIVSEMILISKKIAKKEKVKGYKLVFNVGKEGGQEIFHLHLHFLAKLENNKPINL
jgi:histidine triad (HIT) family protein